MNGEGEGSGIDGRVLSGGVDMFSAGDGACEVGVSSF